MTNRQHVLLAMAGFVWLLSSAVQAEADEDRAISDFRPVVTTIDGEWIGNAISYGPYRDGQEPGKKAPSKAEMAEDLHLLCKHWQLLRVYGTSHCSRELLEVIRDEKLPLKVMLGAWIAPEFTGEGESQQPDEEVANKNREEVAVAIELANEFPEIVWALSIGNETQVDWSDHKVPNDLLLRYLREVRTKTTVPITTADDYSYWVADRSQQVAATIDFVVMHAHPAWHAEEADNAVRFVEKKYAAVKKAHPNRVIVLGETGWPTGKNPEGREKAHVCGIMDEEKQLLACRELAAWAKEQKVTTFMFEAFDENWKGDTNPKEVEKHWGLFRADRTPKPVMQQAVQQQ